MSQVFMIVTSFYGLSLFSLSSVLDTDNSELLRACGTKMPDKVTSSGNKMTVMFKTDGSVDRRGFKATWKQVASKPEPECRHELHEEVNIYDKEDLKWTWAADMKTWQDCAVLCERRRGCSYWTYYRSGYYSGHGIMGRRFPDITSYSFDHVWTSNIVFPTTPGRLI